MNLEIPIRIAVALVMMSFFAEWVDSTLGMGYGTTLTPLLILLFGFSPLQIVPAILLSELATGILAGLGHHAVGNVNFLPETLWSKKLSAQKRDESIQKGFGQYFTKHFRIMTVIAACSIIGTTISATLAVKITPFYIKLYIGILVLIMGIIILLTSNRDVAFSWKKVIGLGLIASFNKGISGGGYGPVVTGGQLLSGIEGKNAVGITSMAEGLTCLAGVVVYLLLGHKIDWTLAPFLMIGSVVSVPFSVLSLKKLGSLPLKSLIGILTVILGTMTLCKILTI